MPSRGHKGHYKKESHHERGFHEKKKKALCLNVLVHTPNFAQPFTLQTDASDTATGAILTQDHVGIECPVANASQKPSKAEKRYATIERECLVIKWGIKHLQYHLMEREFRLLTDHTPLRWLSRSKTDNARIAWWALVLQPFKFITDYRLGVDNKVADFLVKVWKRHE